MSIYDTARALKESVGGTSLTEGESEIQQWSGYNQSYNFAEDRHTLN